MGKSTKTTVMKKLVISAIALLFIVSLSAQPAGYYRVYQAYKGKKGVTCIHVPGFLMKFAGLCAGLDHEERQLLRSLRSVTVLTIEDQDRYPDVNFARDMDHSRMKGDYYLMLEVHESDEDVIIAAREQRGRITDLIVVVGGEENTLVHVRGRMNSDLLEELADVSGVKQLQVTAKI
jgi:hypothetical protein